MKGAGDVVTVDDDFSQHLLSLGVAVELKVDPPVVRESVPIEKKAPMDALPPDPALPEPIVKKRGRPARF